ncbi:DASH complex subunit SPC19 [Nakaseomyces bracarensis]|uniref:DASH complex subunit SPC19 n=1 Tax=Nakaseomyces bracarensis TaxID=273131 RepID=A0ABR4NZY5_9SACH
MDSLEDCVVYLEEAVDLVRENVMQLKEDSVKSSSLCGGMLQINRVFELVPEYDVESARLALFEEVDPMVKTLGDKIEKALVRKRREVDNLRQTVELNRLRLSGEMYVNENDGDMDVSTDAVAIASATDEELDELRALKARRAELQQLVENRSNTD